MRSKLAYRDYVNIHEMATRKLSFSYIAHQYNISENYARIIHKIFRDVKEGTQLTSYQVKRYPSIMKAAQRFHSMNVENSNKTKSDLDVNVVIQLLEENNRLLNELLLK